MMLVRLIHAFTVRQCTLLTPETTCLKQPVFTEPTINLPLSNNWGSINTEAKLLATHYQQTNLDWYNSRNTTKLDESVNRVMPQFKVDGKMVFERDMEMLARVIPKRWNRARSICTCRIAIRATSITTTHLCCNLTTLACSGPDLRRS